jgi:lipopolysaccharide export system permease protein
MARFKKQTVNIKNTEHKLQRTARSYRSDREMSAQMMLAQVREKEVKQKEIITCIAAEIKAHEEFLVREYSMSVMLDSAGHEFLLAKLNSPGLIQKVLQEQRQHVRKIRREMSKYDGQIRAIYRYLVEIHKKYSIPVACFVFVLIGAPLGIKARTGGLGAGTAYSIAFFVLYWACLIGGETLADKLIITPFVAMWLPNVIVGGLGVLLLMRIVRETTFFSYAWMGKLGKKLGIVSVRQDTEGDL